VFGQRQFFKIKKEKYAQATKKSLVKPPSPFKIKHFGFLEHEKYSFFASKVAMRHKWTNLLVFRERPL
jgi:hypothetical protein